VLNKYKIDEFYNSTIVNPILKGSEKILWKGIDVNVIDGAVNGTARVVNWFSQTVRKVQTGVAQFYAVVFVGGIVAVLAWILFHS
jgi:NADH-quinone oxidoreductase subunit L